MNYFKLLPIHILRKINYYVFMFEYKQKFNYCILELTYNRQHPKSKNIVLEKFNVMWHDLTENHNENIIDRGVSLSPYSMLFTSPHFNMLNNYLHIEKFNGCQIYVWSNNSNKYVTYHIHRDWYYKILPLIFNGKCKKV